MQENNPQKFLFYFFFVYNGKVVDWNLSYAISCYTQSEFDKQNIYRKIAYKIAIATASANSIVVKKQFEAAVRTVNLEDPK